MAINKNHEFEELDGIKCGIVEKNVLPERVEFLKKLLEHNHFTVVVVASPPPKVAGKPVVKIETDETVVVEAEAQPAPPETFTVGVTDYTFNTVNAIFGRLLKTPDGQVVSLAYWQQKKTVSQDEVPYYENK
jgi:hypothetical protein